MTNPTDDMVKTLPTFQAIDLPSVPGEITKMLNNNRNFLYGLLDKTPVFTWSNLMQPLEEMSETISHYFSPISHLHAVKQNEELRKIYNDVLPLLTEYSTEISQNEKLYQAVVSLKESDEFKTLTPAQQKIINDDLRDFRLAGIHLPADKKARMAELSQQLSQLMTKFSENLLDATNAWTLHLTDKSKLVGLPEEALQLAIDSAKQRGLEGYLLTLEYPSYSTAIKYLQNRELRKTVYEAYSTRASDRGPNEGRWDNTRIMEDILRVRHEMANLVGFDNFATYSLATKMAKTPEEVLHFLNDLVTRTKPIAKAEYAEVAALAKSLDGITDLQVWDLSYYSEKLQEATFHFSQEDLRPYFPIDVVLNGLFQVVSKLYGLTITEEKNIDVWHPDVRFFSITDDKAQLRGGFYIDLFARPNKRDGAWMDECRTRMRKQNGTLQAPVAYLTCNFMAAVENKPALLTHDDVITLFHEFGHCLHHLLTKVDYPSVAGINGVPWDAVEFPSQFMENFCWERESLDMIAKHYQTGEHLPDALYQKMLAAKNFQTGLQMIRQLEFALFDFRLHLEFDPNQTLQVQKMLDDVRAHASAIPNIPEFNRFQHSFSHIFGGGYAAGYYSYKWAEVLSADAYGLFEEQGLFNPKTGHAFMENILEVGGVRDPMQSFIAFRGREPSIDALLKQSGIA